MYNVSTTSADHCVVAVNEFGDILVVWDEQVTDPCSTTGSRSQCVAVFLPTDVVMGVRKWKNPQISELIGNPCRGDPPYATRCQKAQVVSVGEHFVVVYSRKRTTTGNLSLHDTLDFQGSNPSWHHRRPVLGKTELDSSDSMGLAWSNYDDTISQDDPDIDWLKIEVEETTTTGFGKISEVDDYEPGLVRCGTRRSLACPCRSSRSSRSVEPEEHLP